MPWMFGKTVIYQLKNEFGNFSVEELDYEGRPARVLFSGPLHAAQSGIPLDDNPRLLFDYNRRLLELAIDLSPKKILILGGGTLTLPTAILNSLPVSEITVVEINKDLINIAEKYFDYKPDKRLIVVIGDAFKFVKTNKEEFDLIITDIYNNFTIPQPFRGTLFARELSHLLKNKGTVVTNCISGISGVQAKPLKELVRSYSSAIGAVKVVQASNNNIDWFPQNLIVMAHKGGEIEGDLLRGCSEISLSELITDDNTRY